MNDLIAGYIGYHPVRTQRGLEILTGLTPWVLIAFLFLGSFVWPNAVAYLVLAFNVYWFYRSFQTAVYIVVGHLNMRATLKTNWLKSLSGNPETRGKYKKIHHLVIVPNVKEPLGTLERNMNSLLAQTFPAKQVHVVLAMENRAREFDLEKANYIKRKFQHKFADVFVTWHVLAPGETIGKHSNDAFAAKTVKKILVDRRRIDIKNIIVTTCDVDTVFSSQHFALLTYKFLTSKKPYNRFFQAPLFLNNNINRLPSLMRVRIMMGDAGRLAGLQKPSGRFMNFSAYSMSLALLDRVGYWDVDVIPEDWHINLKCYFATKGDIDIVPLNIPLRGDAPESTSAWKTMVNTYQAEKRWAWGVSDVPYVVKNFFQHPEIPFWNRLNKLLLTAEWHITWSVSWFLITIGATVPTILNPAFSRTALGYNLPRASSLILTTCIIGLLVMTFYGYVLNPDIKHKLRSFLHPLTVLQWISLPIAGLVFGALPGLESQTRLMLGRYIEYRVTEKV